MCYYLIYAIIFINDYAMAAKRSISREMFYLNNILVVFGGKSSEYEVSLRSSECIIRNIPRDKYNVYTLGITRDGSWLYYDGSVDLIPNNEWISSGKTYPAVFSSEFGSRELLVFDNDGSVKEKIKIDAAFPVLHGKNGEDGTIQGLFEIYGIPYVGCGVLSSAACMDKAFTNLVADAAGIPQAKWLSFNSFEYSSNSEGIIADIIDKLGLPVFIKPANAGSSVGITKAKTREDLKKAIELALEHDCKIVAEEAINARELECSVLGTMQEVRTSVVGEIRPQNEFYDYEAKYISDDSELIIPAPVSEETSNELRRLAEKVFRTLDGRGLARVDFFLDKDSGRLLFNEINTIPGFTSISMYPKLFEHAGLPCPELINELLKIALKGK